MTNVSSLGAPVGSDLSYDCPIPARVIKYKRGRKGVVIE